MAWRCRFLTARRAPDTPVDFHTGIKWMQRTLVLQHEALSLKPPKAYVTRLLGARETIHRLKDEERGAKRLRPAAWGPAAPAAFGTRTAATTSWLPPAPPAPYVVAPPRLV